MISHEVYTLLLKNKKEKEIDVFVQGYIYIYAVVIYNDLYLVSLVHS